MHNYTILMYLQTKMSIYETWGKNNEVEKLNFDLHRMKKQ